MKLIFTILLLSLLIPLYSQRSFQYYDSLTYALYEKGRYKEVVQYGNEALSSGYDYYYLRMRLGIAYYNLKQYDRAGGHFKKAMGFSSEKTGAEYFYYSLIYSGRRDEARLFLCENQALLPDISAPCSPLLAGAYAEGGYKKSSGEARNIGDIRFFHAGLLHQPGPRWEIYHGYSNIHQELYSFDYVSNGNGSGPGPGGPTDSVERRSDISLVQNEYYARIAYHAGSGLVFSPAFHYQGVSGMENNTAFSLRIEKPIAFMRWHASAAFSSINDLDQQLYGLGVTLYPLGNTSFYVSATANSHIQEDENSMVYTGQAGIQVVDGFWIDGMYGWGDIYNYADMHAFYLYNIPDVITSRMNISAIFRIARRHSLRAGYLLENKESIDLNTEYTHSGFYISLTLDLP